MNRNWLFTFLLAASVALDAPAQIQYQSQTNNPSTNATLNAAAYGTNGVYVTAGVNSNAPISLSSPLGMNQWSPTTNFPSATSLNSAVYGAGFFILGGSDSTAFTSTDGSNWTPGAKPINTSPFPTVNGLAYNSNGSTFAAVGAIYGAISTAPSTTGTNLTWTIAGQNVPFESGASFLEQYYAVTSLDNNNSNGFAVCGRGGVIRICGSDLVFHISQGYASSDNNWHLNGIAAGRSNIVCVGTDTGGGTSGLIQVLTPAGLPWKTVTNFANLTLNAIVYAGAPFNSFIAVGNNGVILTNSDGNGPWIQATIANGTATNNLRAVTYAASGTLRGSVMISGDNGTIIIAAGLPTGSVTNTNTVCNNGQITLRADLGGSLGPWNLIWTSNGVPVATNLGVSTPTFFTTVGVNTNLTSVITPVFAISNLVDARSLFVAPPGNLTNRASITIDPLLKSTVSGGSNVCNNGMAVATATLSGLTGGTYDVVWSSNGVPVKTNFSVTSPTSLTNIMTTTNLTTMASQTFAITALTNLTTGCFAAPGDLLSSTTFTVNPLIKSAVSGGSNVCNNGTAVATAIFTGLGPWRVTWSSNGVPVLTRTNNGIASDSFTNLMTTTNLIAVASQTFTVSTLVDLGTTELCSAAAGDLLSSTTFTVNPLIKATVSGGSNVCNNGTAVAIASLTGLGPWRVTWSSNGVNVLTRTNNGIASDFFTNLMTTTNLTTVSNQIFKVSALVDLGTSEQCSAATGDLVSSTSFTVNPLIKATVSGGSNVCNNGTAVATALLTGIGPWRVTWSSNGTPVLTRTNNGIASDIFTNLMTTTNLSSAASQTFTVSTLVDLGTSEQCSAAPGDLLSSTTFTINPLIKSTVSGGSNVCNNGMAVATAALTGIGPWRVTWSSNGVAVLTRTNSTGTDNFTNLMTTTNLTTVSNQTYKVSALVDLGTTEQCSAAAGDLVSSTSFTVNPLIKATVSGGSNVCNNGTAVATALLTGIGPWRVTWSSNSTPVLTRTNNGIASDFFTNLMTTTNLTTMASQTFTVSTLVDLGTTEQCSAAPGDLLSSATFTVNPLIKATVSGGSNLCNNGAAVATAALTGIGPWRVTWSSNGVPVLTRTNNGIASDSFTNLMTTTNLTVMASQAFTVSTLVDLGTTEQCSAAAGDLLSSTTFTVNPLIKATVSGGSNVCNNGTAAAIASLTGIGPWRVTWSSNNVPVLTRTNNGIASDFFTNLMTTTNLSTLASQTFTVSTLVDLGTTEQCSAASGDLLSSTTFTVNPLIKATVSGGMNVCNNGAAVATALLTGIGPWRVTWSSNGVNVLTRTNNGIAADVYTNVLTTTNLSAIANVTNTVSALVDLGTTEQCSAAAGDLASSTTFTVNPLIKATVSGGSNVCNNGSAVATALLTGIGPWRVTWSSNNVPVLTRTNNGIASDIFTNVMTTTNLATVSNQTYKVSTLVDLGTTEQCSAASGDLLSSATFTVNPLIKATVSGGVNVCNNGAAVATALLTGIGPWRVTWSSNGVNVLTRTNNGIAADVYTNVLTTTNLSAIANVTNTVSALVDLGTTEQCSAAAGDLASSTTFTVNPLIKATVSGGSNVCNNGSAVATALLTGIGPWRVTWSSNNVPVLTRTNNGIASDIFTNVMTTTNLATVSNQTYKVSTLVDLGTTEQCSAASGDLLSSTTFSVNPLIKATVSADQSNVCNNGMATVTAVLTGIGPWDVVWSSNDVPVVTNSNVGATNALANIVMISTNLSGLSTNTFKVMSLVDKGTTELCSAASTDLASSAVITVANCSFKIDTIALSTNGQNVVITWFGDLFLQGSTNLANTNGWTNIIQGQAGAENTNTNVISGPQQFFRLSNTNN